MPCASLCHGTAYLGAARWLQEVKKSKLRYLQAQFNRDEIALAKIEVGMIHLQETLSLSQPLIPV